MNKSKIEWCDYTVNPVKGLCPVACSYCYARRLYKRFKWDKTIRQDIKAWTNGIDINDVKLPSRIFVGSTFELFGGWVKPEWLEDIFKVVKLFPEHTFIFLTKRPENLIKWSPFPENCWIGASVTNGESLAKTNWHIAHTDAKIKFLSVEPLLGPLPEQPFLEGIFKAIGINWLIIGQQTPVKPSTSPKIEWVKEIVEAADKANVPVFLKNNLGELLVAESRNTSLWKIAEDGNSGTLRQEFPRVPALKPQEMR